MDAEMEYDDAMDIDVPAQGNILPAQLRLDDATLVLAIHPKMTEAVSVFMWPPDSPQALAAGAQPRQRVLMPMPVATIVFRVPTGTHVYAIKNRLSADIYFALKPVSENEIERAKEYSSSSSLLMGPATAELSDVTLSKSGYPMAGYKWFPMSTGGRVGPLPDDGPDAPVEDEITLRVSHHVAFCIAMRSLLRASRPGSEGLKCSGKFVPIRWPSMMWSTRDLTSLYMDQLELPPDCPVKLRLGASLALSPHKTTEPMRWNNVQIQDLMHLTGTGSDSQQQQRPEQGNPLIPLVPPPIVVEKTAGTWATVLQSRLPETKSKKSVPKKPLASVPKTKRQQDEAKVVNAKGQLSLAAAFARPAKRAKKEETEGSEKK